VPVFYFEGMESREAAETLVGRYLEAPAHELVRENPWERRDEFMDLNPAGETPVMVDGEAGITLIQQTTPVDPRCPRNTRDATGAPVSLGEVIAAGQYCLGLSVGPPPPVTPADTNADIAFGITDGLDGMTFSVSLTRRN